ncbi:MAG: hypothetical protein Q9182_002441 [Xanthomendoza sp. 2 TL-2023]
MAPTHHLPSPPLPRSSHTFSIIKGKAYLFGGATLPHHHPADNAMHILTLLPLLYRSPTSTTRTSPPQDPLARTKSPRQESDTHTPPRRRFNDRIYIFGGRGGLLPSLYPDPRSYHASTSTVHPLPSAADPEAHGTIFIHAGCAAAAAAAAAAAGRLNDLWAFDVAARTWSPFPSAPGPARGGASLAFARDRLYRFGGFDGKTVELGGQIDYLDLMATTITDDHTGESAVIAKTGHWETVSIPSPPAKAATNYLLLFLGEKQPSSSGRESSGQFWDDVWAFQLRPDGMTAASFKDAARELVGASSAEDTWARVEIAESSMTEGVRGMPGALGWFASARAGDVEPEAVVLWGGVGGGGGDERVGEGWVLVVE